MYYKNDKQYLEQPFFPFPCWLGPNSQIFKFLIFKKKLGQIFKHFLVYSNKCWKKTNKCIVMSMKPSTKIVMDGWFRPLGGTNKATYWKCISSFPLYFHSGEINWMHGYHIFLNCKDHDTWFMSLIRDNLATLWKCIKFH